MGASNAVAMIVAVLVLIVLILAATVGLVGMYRLLKYNAMFMMVWTPRARLSDIYDHLKTGDIILFVSAVHTSSNSILTQTFHSHAGMLMREGDLMYISEAHLGGIIMPDASRPGKHHHMRHGADITPLLPRLKYYTGNYYILRLSRPLAPEREAALRQRMKQLRDSGHPYPTVPQACLSILGWNTDSNHCFQHVAQLIDEAGLTPVDRSAPLRDSGFSEVCHAICEISGRPLPGGYSYLDPVQVIYDVDTVRFGADGAHPGDDPDEQPDDDDPDERPGDDDPDEQPGDDDPDDQPGGDPDDQPGGEKGRPPDRGG